VANNTRIAIAGGDGEHSIHGCGQILEKGGVTYLQADIIGVGGFTNWRSVSGLAEAYHVDVAPHGASFPELNAHLVAALPHGISVSTSTPGQPPEVWSRLYQDFGIENGRIQLTSKPGLGLEFDEDFLSHCQVARLES